MLNVESETGAPRGCRSSVFVILFRPSLQALVSLASRKRSICHGPLCVKGEKAVKTLGFVAAMMIFVDEQYTLCRKKPLFALGEKLPDVPRST